MMATRADLALEFRVDRRKRRNREALIEAADGVMTEKGIDAATMLEIAELADVGAGTVYNYFESKDELAVCVMERVMHRLAERIDAVDWSKRDPTSLFYVPCQAEHPEDSFFLDCAERRHPLCPSMWLENTAWPLQPNIEAIQPDVQSSRVDEVLVQSAIQTWRSSKGQHGRGNEMFFDLALSLKRAGKSFQEIQGMLRSEAHNGNTPKERLAQIPSIMSSLGRYFAAA